ncbi:MAG: ATP-binding protein, partial [Eubacteriales bacterium]|nr:ATP-binding protein [Eubacteriales bacterium]
ISKFQLAKAAVAAGIRILAQEENISLSDIDRLILGGGFGSFAHRKNAALLGIIPQECVDRSEKLGNTALAGAISAALSGKARNELSRLQKIVSAVDLSTHSSFSTEFMDAMTFEQGGNVRKGHSLMDTDNVFWLKNTVSDTVRTE